MLMLGQRDNLVVMDCCVEPRDHQQDVADSASSVLQIKHVSKLFISMISKLPDCVYHGSNIFVVDVSQLRYPREQTLAIKIL